ncbi:MAG: SCP2 domain-containing protein [Pseudomonadota bacterium]|nr:MAG: SCP2 domain-containing protein [Pseudomonadota bacterium]
MADIMLRPDLSRPLDLVARWMPPPRLVALPVRCCPQPLQRQLLEQLLNHLLGDMVAGGDFAYLSGHRLAIEVSDMDLRWVITSAGHRLETVGEDEPADSTIRGRAVEFILLASRLEDPDTLFFQRRLEVIGNTTIGLTTRNLLDRLPLDELPLALRIVLNRAGRFARRIRAQKELTVTPGLPQARE